MSLHELYSRLIRLLIESTGLPSFIPLIGDVNEVVAGWARNNPEEAGKLADEMYQLLQQYKGGLK